MRLSDSEYYRISTLQDKGSCICFQMAPCSWCAELSEEEIDILCNYGIEDLHLYWKLKLQGIESDPKHLDVLRHL